MYTSIILLLYWHFSLAAHLSCKNHKYFIVLFLGDILFSLLVFLSVVIVLVYVSIYFDHVGIFIFFMYNINNVKRLKNVINYKIFRQN